MSGKLETLAALRRTRLVAVLRGLSLSAAEPLGPALVRGGVSCMEVTVETPGALSMIELLSRLPGVTVGAGTVLDAESAGAAIRAGARFVVSPAFNPDVVRLCRRWGVVVVPGAMTPTEILAAAEAGADLVKLFPAGTMGAKYVREVRGPLGHIDLMVTGGITAESASEYLAAGAAVVGVGGYLADKKLIAEGRWAEVEQRASALMAAVSGT